MRELRVAYFERLFEESAALVAEFPLTLEPASMEYITGVLEPAVEARREHGQFIEPSPSGNDVDEVASRPAGLNTVGMLLDRLSILAIKHWNLVHRAKKPDKADELAATQIRELIGALAEARPGHSSINNKMTAHRAEAEADSFPRAFFGLLTTNLLLWEAQEILYNHDILALPCEELRAYILFFSRGNLSRNAYIQSSDQLYWTGVKGGANT